MFIKGALNKESSYEVSLKLDEKCSRGSSYSSQIVFFQSLHYTCFCSVICPLQVPGSDLLAFFNFMQSFTLPGNFQGPGKAGIPGLPNEIQKSCFKITDRFNFILETGVRWSQLKLVKVGYRDTYSNNGDFQVTDHIQRT